MATPDQPTEADGGGPALGEVLLVALAILALVVAAFALPPLGTGAADPGDREGPEFPWDATPSSPETPTEPSEGPGGLDRDDVRIVDDGEGGGQPVSEPRVGEDSASDPHPDCFVVVWDRLVPGDEATVLVWNDRQYVGRQEVWFDGTSIGRTDNEGIVQGRVPYHRQLRITANVPPVESCHFVHLQQRQGYDEYVEAHGDRPTILVGDPGAGQEPVDGNITGQFPVHGEVALDVSGEPYPGETLTVEASVADVPMRDASVRVDGERVARTDRTGEATVRVPDDRRPSFELSVERGDFRGDRRIRVLLLTLAIRPNQPLPLPGQSATLVARVGDQRASEVPVTLDGERVGTTDDAGVVATTLPEDPLAHYRAVGAHGQVVTTGVWPHYLFTVFVVVFVLGLVVVSVLGVARREVGPSWRRVAVGWVAVGALVAAWILWGARGLLAGLALLALAGICYGGYRRRADIAAALRGVRDSGRGLRAWIQSATLRLATALADLAGRLPSGARGLVRAVLGLVRAGLARLRRELRRLLAQPQRLPAVVAALLGRLWRDAVTFRRAYLSRWLVLAVVGAVLVVLGAAWVAGTEGALVALAALVGLAVVWWWRQTREASSTPEAVESSATATSALGVGEDGTEDRRGLRELWRTFARLVVPGRWRSRTPGEVARAAIDRGFPAAPVERLTTVFREVEYGDRSLSEGRLQRARTAFDELREDDDEEVAD